VHGGGAESISTAHCWTDTEEDDAISQLEAAIHDLSQTVTRNAMLPGDEILSGAEVL
jgi:hypothetical protein